MEEGAGFKSVHHFLALEVKEEWGVEKVKKQNWLQDRGEKGMMKTMLTSQDKDTGECCRVRVLKIKDAVLCFPTTNLVCWMCCGVPRLHKEFSAITVQVLVLAHEPGEGGEQAGQVAPSLFACIPGFGDGCSPGEQS